MFEKESEEWWNNEYLPSLYDNVSDVWKDGAEFGYKKGTEKAKEVLEGLMRFCRCFAQHHTEDIRYKEAEQFLKEVEE